jgi:malate dehydrogenase
VDPINFLLCNKTGISRERCIGFGGQLDSARFGLALRMEGIGGIPSVLGEHGEHQVPVYSRLESPVGIPRREEILAGLRGASMEIIQGKGGTVFGPAYHLAMLVKSVLTDSRDLHPCSSVLDGEYGLSGCSLGVPARIGKDGIHAIEEWNLDDWEQEKMAGAGSFIRELCQRAVS